LSKFFVGIFVDQAQESARRDLMKTDPIDLDDFGDRKTGFEISVLFFGFAIEVQAHSLARDV